MLSSLCLSGTGTGRIEYRGNKYLFDYKALHNQKKRNWTIGVDLPLTGQEILSFDYMTNSVTGPFAYRLRKQDQKNQMSDVYRLLGHLLKMVDELKLKKGWSVEGLPGGKVRLSGGDEFSADFFSKEDGRFRRTILSFTKNPSQLFRLQLFSDSCTLK